jgi:hypothetical protein
MKKLLTALIVGVLPLGAAAQDHSRHDIAFNSIRNVKAVVDTTVTTVQTFGSSLTTIVGNVGDPIPGCVGRVCGAPSQ